MFEDAWLIAVDKPSGLLVHPGWARDRDTALTRARRLAGAWVYPAHRLDRGTSGVLLFAKSPEIASKLGEQFGAGAIAKSYLALVRGKPPDEGLIDSPVPKGERGERVSAVTGFRCLARSSVERCSLVEAKPQTGRLHQIRRHLKHISHPIIGDVRYGKGPINRHYREHWGLKRMALHAVSLSLRHPMSGDEFAIAAPLPADLADCLRRLGVLASEGAGSPPVARVH